MTIDLVSVIVDDYDRAIEFFTSALDFEVTEDEAAVTTEGRPKRWVVVRPNSLRTGLVLALADGPEQSAIVGRQFAGRVGLFLRVSDVEATLNRVISAGGQLVRTVRTEPYGVVAVFRDPWGNLWDLLGPASDQ